MATAPSPFPTFPSVTPPPPFCFGAPPYAPYPFPYPNQPPPPSPSYHAAAYHHHHRFQLPPPSHPNPHWHQGMQQMQPPPSAPGNPWHPHHAAAQPPPPSSPPPRRPPPSSPPPLAASMAAAAPAWPFPSASVPAVQEGAAPSTSSSGRLPDSPRTTSAAAALIVLCSGLAPERRPSSPSSALVPAPSATQARRSTPPTTNTPYASGASTGPAVLGSTTAAPLVGNTTTSPAATTSPTTTPSAEARVPAEASISKNMPRAILDLKRRLDEQQARDRTSFDKLKGELEKLTSMAAQLATFIGKHTTAAIPGSSPLEVTCTAPIAPKVYDTMPTPSSGYDNFSVHSDQSPAVQDGGTNPREQNLDELPPVYGLHNLICRTVVRADGSEHSYYALPGNYTLEQDMPEPLLSNKFVGASDSTPEQQPCEEEQQECEQPLKCLSKKIETEHTSAYVSIISEVLELQPQDDGKSRNCPALKTSDPYVTRSSQFSIMCSVTEMRLLWDPGDTTSYALFTTADSATNLQCTNVYKPAVVQILAVQFGVRRVLIFKSAVMHCDALGLARTKVTGSALFVLVVPGSAGTACPSPSFENMAKLLWDPGILHYMAPNGCNSALQDNSFILQMAAHLSECKYPCSLYCICMMNAEYCPMRCLGEISASCMKRLQYNPGDFTHILLVLCVSCRAITDNCFAGQKLMANTSRKGKHLHGTSTKWASTSPNGITSSEYAFTMDFIIGQCKFLHKQGVQSYNAKNLLSSSNYLQILEMGIIFITFLPP